MIDSDKSLSLNYANISVRNVLLFYPVYLKSSTVTFGAPLRNRTPRLSLELKQIPLDHRLPLFFPRLHDKPCWHLVIYSSACCGTRHPVTDSGYVPSLAVLHAYAALPAWSSS